MWFKILTVHVFIVTSVTNCKDPYLDREPIAKKKKKKKTQKDVPSCSIYYVFKKYKTLLEIWAIAFIVTLLSL